MNSNDRKTIDKLRLERAVLIEDTLKLRAQQIELEHQRAALALDIANNDRRQNHIDQIVASTIRADFSNRVTE